jgi:hypothetical protein
LELGIELELQLTFPPEWAGGVLPGFASIREGLPGHQPGIAYCSGIVFHEKSLIALFNR